MVELTRIYAGLRVILITDNPDGNEELVSGHQGVVRQLRGDIIGVEWDSPFMNGHNGTGTRCTEARPNAIWEVYPEDLDLLCVDVDETV